MSTTEPRDSDFTGLPGYAEARKFCDEFEPIEGVDYGWVADYAKDRQAMLLAAFKDLDDKAGAIITYLGSGTGLLTLGALAAAGSGALPALVVAIIPAVVMATASLWQAAEARKTISVAFPPTVATATRYAKEYKDRGK